MSVIVAKASGWYSINLDLQYPRIGVILPPSTLVGALSHSAINIYNDFDFAKKVYGAYIIFDEKTKLIVNKLQNTIRIKSKNVIRTNSSVNNYVYTNSMFIAYIVNEILDKKDAKLLIESIPTFGWNDNIIQAKFIDVITSPDIKKNNYVNTYTRLENINFEELIINELMPFITKLKEDVVIRNSIKPQKIKMVLKDYAVPITIKRSYGKSEVYTGMEKLYTKEIDTIKVGRYYIPLQSNVEVIS